MDVVLKVLAGAKEGTKIAVKKETFLIGRSQQCHLCVGSSSISRKHCMISRSDTSVTVKDLDSSNGTFVNGKRITEETKLSSGDELEVGSLLFLVTVSPGISNRKRSEIKSVADAVERVAETGQEDLGEEDISSWLLGPGPLSPSATETQTIQMDDTGALQTQLAAEQQRQKDAESQDASSDSEPTKKKPKEPGKLPPIPASSSTKNSGEAAEEALRSWNRRR